jgi:hypothetical protein
MSSRTYNVNYYFKNHNLLVPDKSLTMHASTYLMGISHTSQFMIATKKQQLAISISTINDTDYFGKGISISFFCYNFQIVVLV